MRDFTCAAETIYTLVLVHKYTISNVWEYEPNKFIVVMKKGRHTRSVILCPSSV